ncbi:WecB/TagA/CpsF family glycosyltransferase [Marinobacter salsuginis]|uniref:WecB/TagA/CpsF family glycosyltransferase n=1 Tax=Marinobacter salsuginis TaxID=418719 RepID=UPI00273DF7AC|nr:WecB/TagA/CpsF family glycosyltransferase [Marinobacter salsuginis]
MAELIKIILDSSSGFSMPDEKKVSTFLNHYSYQLARKNIDAFAAVDHIYCDGILLCLFFRLLGFPVERKSFDMTSVAPEVFADAEARGLSLALIGGKPGVVEAARDQFLKSFPNLHVVFLHSGFFDGKAERDAVIDQVCKLSPSIVICGMGTPLQETFLSDLCAGGWNGAGYTCGGFFHQTAQGGVDYYPAWMDRLNLRWLYRIYDEPKLISRYTVDVFGFLRCFFTDYRALKKKSR